MTMNELKEKYGIVPSKMKEISIDVYNKVHTRAFGFDDIISICVDDTEYNLKISDIIALSKYNHLTGYVYATEDVKPTYNIKQTKEVFATFPCQDILSQVKSKSTFDAGLKKPIKLSSKRLKLFASVAVPTCICCGKIGVEMRLERSIYGKKQKQPYVNPHFNLYTDDGILMTQDHIIPLSKGGADSMENLQIMCVVCNNQKGNVLSDDDLRKGKFKEQLGIVNN